MGNEGKLNFPLTPSILLLAESPFQLPQSPPLVFWMWHLTGVRKQVSDQPGSMLCGRLSTSASAERGIGPSRTPTWAGEESSFLPLWCCLSMLLTSHLHFSKHEALGAISKGVLPHPKEMQACAIAWALRLVPC